MIRLPRWLRRRPKPPRLSFAEIQTRSEEAWRRRLRQAERRHP